MKKLIPFLIGSMMFQIAVSQSVQLNIKAYIEGPYYNGQMTPFLNVLGHLPTSQPYNTAPWNYPGTESVTSFPSSNIVDWVLVDILKPHSDGNQIRFEVMGRKAGFLFKNGFIKDIDGISNLSIETKMTSGFYIRIHHRNHLSVISSVPLVESGGIFSYDFTTSADQVLGGFLRQKQLSSTIWGMIAADANASGQIDNRDKNEVWLPQQGLTGYYEGDFNMDTQVDMDDKVVKWEPNAGKSSYPVRDTILPLFICGSSSVMFNGLEYGTVKFNNKCWLDRNLGANQVATAYNDPLSYGELFQWGRLIDGHQSRNSATTNILSASDIPGHGDFIITEDDPYDWRNPQNNNLWQETTNINNPCPDGWNVPSLTQWQEATTGWTNRTDAFNSLLKLPAAGWRSESAGNLSNVGSWGNYWTTAVNATGARGVQFDSFNFNTGTYARASGRSVRCLKTDYVPNNPPAEPSDPNPENSATGVETNINLSWVCSDLDGDDLTYNIYFGTAAIPSLIVSNFTDNTWNPGLLNLNTNYYWKIVAYDIYGDSTQGSIWNFTTKIPFDCGDVLVDTRDGQNYNTVQIGEQCWMAENLNIGTMIQGTTTMTNNSVIERYCYDNSTANCDTYGGLYQWNEMMSYSSLEGKQGICPTGWHLPSDTEWCTVSLFIDITVNCDSEEFSGTDVGDKMKSTSGWFSGGNGINSSGFSVLPGAGRNGDGSFGGLGARACFWSSTENYSNDAFSRLLDYNQSGIGRFYDNNIYGFSVRCLKDTPPPTWSCGDPLNDTRDGQTYNTVQIGEQCWMAENLNIGTMITGTSEMTNNSILEKYCYDDNTANCDTYGGLYQWDEMMAYITQEGTQGICPIGWHLPTDSEFKNLEILLGMTQTEADGTGWRGTDEGGKLKEIGTTHWEFPNTGATNTSGFNALPGGYRISSGDFFSLSEIADFWSSTQFNSSFAWARGLQFDFEQVNRGESGNFDGFSVRCIKDTSPTWSCGDPLNDTRDGQTYNTVQIGEQCWMAENLNVGTMIQGTSEMTNNTIIEKYCYDNNSAYCDNYGALYQWNEMMQYTTQLGTQGICPVGWHLPSDAEYTLLTDFLGGLGIAGGKMKETGYIHWNSPNTGATNESGFLAFGGGGRDRTDGLFYNIGVYGLYWSSSESITDYAWRRSMRYDQVECNRNNTSGKNDGFSVRCVKDTPPPTWSCGDPLNDTRDGQTYNTVQIGEQCWMAENLNIGTLTQGNTEMTNNSIIEKYCYDNTTANCDTYGGLYQWNEMMAYSALEGSQGICPAGWHLPMDIEWTTLTTFLGGESIAGGKMKTIGTIENGTGLWFAPNTGSTNESGFFALPDGNRSYGGGFGGIGLYAYFWSSTESNLDNAWHPTLYNSNAGVTNSANGKDLGFGIRCLKDSPPPTWSCGDPLNDTRDNQTYNTVQIGEQCWMAENLNIGTLIPAANEMTNNSVIERYCYNDDEANCSTYGGLYQWNEMMAYSVFEGSQGICPLGWHLPADGEWSILTTFLGGESIAGGKLKATGTIEAGTGLWYAPNAGATNESGFTALPGGDRGYDGTSYYVGSDGYWWSSTEFSAGTAFGRKLVYYNADVLLYEYSKPFGFSVRCVKGDGAQVNLPPVLPFNPSPANGIGNQPLNTTLSWSCIDPENDPLTYDVYFGTSNPPALVSSGQTSTTFNPGALAYSTLYYWKIVAHDAYSNSVEGPVFTFTTKAWRCTEPMVDTRDGQTYSTIQIDAQCWMAENLNIGTMIQGTNNMANNGVFEKYCYNNNPDSCDVYGGIYQWEEVMQYSLTTGVQGICPTGWHIPTDLEWNLLINYLGGTSIAGGKMKETGFAHWISPNTGATNESGFFGLPGGTNQWGEFMDIGTVGYWWSSTIDHLDQKTFFNVYHLTLSSNSATTATGSNSTLSLSGISVRCINDEAAPGFPTVTTAYINNINQSSAIGGGSVTALGNSPVTGRGICWSTSQYPTTNDPHTLDGGGTGTFTSEISGLITNTVYYVRAYATDSTCTAYGNMVSFVAQDSGGGGEPCTGIPTVTYEGQVYNTVQIGSQCWFRENLNVGVQVDGGSYQTNNGQIEKDCYYHEPGYCDIYGGLYCWGEMMQYSTVEGTQGICPTGWHIPTGAEWTTLTTYLGGANIAGGKMKEAGFIHWNQPNIGATNESGFSGLPGGSFTTYYFGWDLNFYGGWWSSTNNDPLEMNYNSAEIQLIYAMDGWGYSVRCLKD